MMLMKKIFILAAALLALSSCGRKPAKQASYELPAPADVVMYQINPRLFADSLSLRAVLPQLDSIKSLGTNVVWIMPIYPIGHEKSKNSPYSIADYCAVNPEFGSLEDFKTLVDECHGRGMAFIMDWVANHTAWDSKWIAEGHSDWYTRDSAGNIIYPEGTDWTDVADLDYSNPAMRARMTESMLFWVQNYGVDGFRCDVADEVPADFWKECISTIRSKAGRPILMLAEGRNPDNFDSGFDLNYAWDYLNALRDVFRRDSSALELLRVNEEEYAEIPAGKCKLRFTTNHDEATKMSTVQEFGGRQGALAAYAAAIYMNGAALLYGQQETAYPETINFFKYTPVDWSAAVDVRGEYRQMLHVFSRYPEIHGAATRSFSNDDILALQKGENFLVLVNVRAEALEFPTPEGWTGVKASDLRSGESLVLGDSIALSEYQYLLLKK
jgi:1,4-alpha-glucan branching enzyme